MKKVIKYVLLVMALLGAIAFTSAQAQSVQKPARVESALIKTAVIVEAVNKETRELKLIDTKGNRFLVTADARVRNFDQIQPRDRIVLEYFESVAVVIAPAGSELPIGDASVLELAPEGSKPGVESVDTTVLLARVQSVNMTDRVLTVETEFGDIRSIMVRDEAPLDQVTVGDQLRLRITRAMAISVVTPED